MRVFKLAITLLASCVMGTFASKALSESTEDELDAQKDSSFVTAVNSGKAIAVISNLWLAGKYPDRESAQKDEFQTDLSSYIEWVNRRDPSKILTSGHSAEIEGVAYRGPLLDMVAGSSNYQIFIVDPGIYDLSVFGYDLPNTAPPKQSQNPTVLASKVATLDMLTIVKTQMKSTRVWQDAVRGNRTESYQECAAVHITAGCVEVRNGTRNVEYTIRPEGYYEVVAPQKITNTRVRAKLTQPFASFTIGSGEVVLVDGLYAEAGNFLYDENTCQGKSAGRVECALRQISLRQSPASQSALRTVPFARNGYPKLAKLLNNLQIRHPEINGQPTSTTTEPVKTFKISID
jgi:hypothetical protein